MIVDVGFLVSSRINVYVRKFFQLYVRKHTHARKHACQVAVACVCSQCLGPTAELDRTSASRPAAGFH
jgi:hypothetical protein